MCVCNEEYECEGLRGPEQSVEVGQAGSGRLGWEADLIHQCWPQFVA